MCGVIGIIGPEEAAKEVFMGLFTVQHRGQDAAGILSYDDGTNGGDGLGFHLWKDTGLVDNVFNAEIIERLKGRLALGHTRYSTVGSSDDKNGIQPLVLNYPYGIGMAHNGNVVNYYELSEKLRKEKHRLALTTNDLEVIQNFFADALLEQAKKTGVEGGKIPFEVLVKAVNAVFESAIGGYSVVGMIAGQGLMAFRDPKGIRPLILGQKTLSGANKKKAYCVASESIILSFLGYEIIGDVKPGELIFVDMQGHLQRKIIRTIGKPAHCMFEWVYFAGAESIVENRPVYSARLALGKGLAKLVRNSISQGEISPDIIVPVPETSRIAAIAMSEALGIPYREVLIKNRYIHRSFILNTQEKRAKAVDMKLNPVRSEIAGKNILLVDDSIVRGTTSQRLINLVRRAGAKEVYFVSTCSPIRYPCYYGIDFPDPQELLATGRDEKQIAKKLNADKVIYLDQKSLKEAIGLPTLCMACLDGKYPTDISAGEQFREKRENHRRLVL